MFDRASWPQDLPGLKPWNGLTTIGLVLSECLRDGKETIEIRYSIDSLGMNVKLFAHAVRCKSLAQSSRKLMHELPVFP